MLIYKISSAQHIEQVTLSDQLTTLSGKFLYFPHHILVIDESGKLFHKDIDTFAKHSGLSTEPPTGYGRMSSGEIESWKSNFFGITPLELRPTISRLLASLP